MIFNENEIDETFKEAFYSQKIPPYKDSFFDEVAALLPQKRSKKALYFWFSGLGLVLIFGSLYFTFNGKSIEQNSTIHKEAKLLTSIKTGEIQKEKHIEIENKKPEKKNINNLNNRATKNFINDNYEDLDVNLTFKEKGNEEMFVEISNTNETVASEVVENQVNDVHESDSPISSLKFLSNLKHLETDNFDSIQSFENLVNYTKKYLQFNVSTGLGSSFIPSAKQNPSFVASLGTAFELRKDKFNLSFGLNYTYYKMDNISIAKNSKVYGFDLTKYAQNIEFKNITSIALPIELSKNFRFGKVGFGIAPSYNLASTVDFTKQRNSVVLEDTRIYGNTIGLKKFGLNTSISYDLTVLRNLEIGVKISSNLINPLDQNRFEEKINKMPFQGQIGIKKYFRIK